MELVIRCLLLGMMTVTAYQPVREQTDSTPFNTSTGERVRAGGAAISRDLLCGACRRLHHRCKHPDNPTKIHYGDWLYVDGYGYRQVNDVMGAYTTQKVYGKKVRIPIKQHIDIFVWTWKEEHAVQVKHLAVFKVKGEPSEQ